MLEQVTHHRSNNVVIASAKMWSWPLAANRPDEDIITTAYRGAGSTSDGSWDVDDSGHANGGV